MEIKAFQFNFLIWSLPVSVWTDLLVGWKNLSDGEEF